MIMKNLRLIIVALFAFVSSADMLAAGLTPVQTNFRSSIMQFLREEGFMPTIEEESNSINFKKEGVPYWIALDGNSPVYVEFHRAGLSADDVDRNAVVQTLNEINKNMRCAKVVLNDNNAISFAVEIYCHSAEEFKYVFYKYISELDGAAATFLQAGSSSDEGYDAVDSVAVDDEYAGSSAIDKFFPVYGLTLGSVSVKDMKSRGYTVKKMESGSQYCDVRSLTFWDHNKDNIFEDIYITQSDALPDSWEDNLGLNWSLSYNQILSKFRGWGFTIKVDKEPQTKTYSGRKTLSADVTATSADGRIAFIFDFDYGNDNGEGYSTNAKNSLYSVTIKTY